MDRDSRIFVLFIALPAVLITAAGLFTLVFGVSGITAEMEFSDVANQMERYERNIKRRTATRLREYAKSGKADFVWRADALPWGTNVSPRVKYGVYTDPGGNTVGWARSDEDTVVGYRMPPFEEEDRTSLYLVLLGAVMVALLFCTLSAGGLMLARSARRAREDLETKDSFLDVISHELNTPLGSIVPLSSALAAGRIRDGARRAEAVATISRESSRMARMIHELLTVVRLRNGKTRFLREKVDLAKAAENAASLVCVRHPDAAIMFADGPALHVSADPDKVEQVVVNLIENACRYAAGDDIVVSCSDAGGGFARVEVSDRGPGFTEEERARIFDRFFQSSSGTGCGGLGLGLNIVSGFAAGMGGKAGVRAREGGGSVFFVDLPVFGGKREV